MKKETFHRTFFPTTCLFLVLSSCTPQGQTRPIEDDDRQFAAEAERWKMSAWFQDAKFGMFIHWGVYSVLGDGEWVMHNRKMTIEAYEQLPARFNPTKYDPRQWVALAKEAGMRYITITSKHHDGFAMWDSEVSDYDIVDRTPYGKDVLKMLAEECRKQGLELFFYYSHLDWHHPDYYPRGKTGQHSGRPDEGDFDAYLDYMNAQIRELADGDYGELGGFWFDGWWDHHLDEQNKSNVETDVNWRLQEAYDLVHRLQPRALIGNNHHVAPFPGEDFQMFERDLPGRNTSGYNITTVGSLPLESCDTMNGSWGYRESDKDFKSATELIHYLVRSAGYSANLLLNVGPTAEGTFQPEVVDRLREMGRWTREFGDSIYGTRGGPMPPQDWGVSTQKGNAVYVHILDGRAAEALTLPGTSRLDVQRVSLFGTNEAIPFTREGDVVIELPLALRNAVDTIVVIHLAG
jgi:alpha-L-fucosidase